VLKETLSGFHTRAVLTLLAWWCAIFVVTGLHTFSGRLGGRCALCDDEACTRVRARSLFASPVACASVFSC
jgi:hypothetical protein